MKHRSLTELVGSTNAESPRISRKADRHRIYRSKAKDLLQARAFVMFWEHAVACSPGSARAKIRLRLWQDRVAWLEEQEDDQ